MNTPSEYWRPRISKTVVAVVVVAVLVVAIAVIAAFLLASAKPGSDWIPVYQDVLKTSFTALAIGALGGLAKLIFDQRKAEQESLEKLRDRVGYISTLVTVSHDIDTARLVVLTNRSVKSWTDMINDRVIPAHSRLRDMTHQLLGWDVAGLPVFRDTASVAKELEDMTRYLRALLDEYANKKQDLGELQLQAEDPMRTSQEDQEQLLNRIWYEMQHLTVLGDLISHDRPSDSRYVAYRRSYALALLEMRRSFVPTGRPSRRMTVSSPVDVTTPSSSDPR
jgi:hypothetical protein